MTTHEEPRITRLTELTPEPGATGRYAYQCNKCGEMDWGNGDSDRRHVKWRQKHWVECWGLTPQEYWMP